MTRVAPTDLQTVGGRADVALRFGTRAQALNALAVPLPREEATFVRFDPNGLDPEERTPLASLPGSRLTDTSLLAPVEPLRRLAESCETAACLLAAADAAADPPRAPEIMGILNVTPDSFSDGGRFLAPQDALRQADALVRAGARWLDVGGESTRPGAEAVPTDVELRRVEPVLAELGRSVDVPVSIDTRKAQVARRAVELGARMVNDTSAGRHDPEMLPLVSTLGTSIVLMHARGEPRDMQRDPVYTDPVFEIARFLRERVHACLKVGIAPHKIVLDPGIGFGKRLRDNLEILGRLSELRSLGLPLLLGVSRKSFIAHVTHRQRPDDWQGFEAEDRPTDRLGGTAAAVTACVLSGADILRVHDVGIMAEAARVAADIRPYQAPMSAT